jgi:branched-chain amino acid transport system ATP-binding protein
VRTWEVPRLSALVADKITAGYSKVPVIEGVSIASERGKVTAIVGPNGSGKSTLLKAIFGLLKSVEGRVILEGRDVTKLRTTELVRNGLAYVPQVNSIFPSLSVLENLEMGAYLRRNGLKSRMDEVISIFPDLRAAQYRRAGALSGGQRSLLALARALMVDPAVLMLDEPTSGLAPMYAASVWNQIRLIAEKGTAVIVVEQNVDFALDNADWVYVLVSGRNRLDGPPNNIRRQPLAEIFLGGQTDFTGNDEHGHVARSVDAPGIRIPQEE